MVTRTRYNDMTRPEAEAMKRVRTYLHTYGAAEVFVMREPFHIYVRRAGHADEMPLAAEMAGSYAGEVRSEDVVADIRAVAGKVRVAAPDAPKAPRARRSDAGAARRRYDKPRLYSPFIAKLSARIASHFSVQHDVQAVAVWWVPGEQRFTLRSVGCPQPACVPPGARLAITIERGFLRTHDLVAPMRKVMGREP